MSALFFLRSRGGAESRSRYQSDDLLFLHTLQQLNIKANLYELRDSASRQKIFIPPQIVSVAKVDRSTLTSTLTLTLMSKFYIDPDISKAKTIDTEFYTSEEIFELSKERIFASSWQYSANTNQISSAGSAYPFNLLEDYLGEPLILTKDLDNQIHCLSNVCTHRGNLLVYEPCSSVKMMTCKYHGRAFQLDGTFKFMPEFKEVENFPTEEDNLTILPVFQWGKMIFTQLTTGLQPDLYFGEMMERLRGFPFDKMVYHPELSKEFRFQANWALYCENYLEGFHIPFVHAGLNESLDFGSYQTEIFKYSSLQLGVAKVGEFVFDLPESSKDYGHHIAAYYFWVFPNMMFNVYPWGLSLNIVEPISISESKVKFHTFIWDEDKYNKGAGSDLDTVEFEDEEIVVNVQKGIRSRFYNHGRYSVKREQGTHHFHSLLANALN